MFAVLLLLALVTYGHAHHCGVNEHYLVAGPPIEPTCRVWRPVATSSSKKTSGCFCMAGKVREEKTGCCVDMGKCRCGHNEYRNSLGNCVLGIGAKLGAVIGTRRKCPVGYEPDTSGKCCVVCPQGTVKNKYGKCVSITQIKACEAGEEYKECCPVIQPTCAQPVVVASLDCKPGCVCKPGLVRNSCGKCISIDSCI